MYSVANVEKSAIQWHYDLSTVFYRLIWGPHIHHGLWNGSETPAEAQRNLMDTLAANAGLRRDERVLDVGCGMGGSSIHLAQMFRCHVTGITLSPVQRLWASAAARWSRVADRTAFRCQDVENAAFDSASFDVVWSIECTEHLFDKAEFFRRAAKWLQPGGRLAICAWLAKDAHLTVHDENLLRDVCRGMLCPSLGSRADYAGWFEAAGLRLTRCEDWTSRVKRTWEICRERVGRFRLRSLARWFDRDSVDFLDRFQTMLDAYSTGAMRYGCLIAEKPS
jgi:tocopherol O-methyltransferase